MFQIAGRRIGIGEPLFVVAEIGLNHDGSLDRALALVEEAARAGAQAIKLQTLYADRLVAAHCPAPQHVRAESLRALFAHFELDEAAHATVASRARQHGLAFMSTPFDEASVAMLERLGCDAFKIASGDITHHPLIARVARTGKPMIMSTGLSKLHEVRDAIDCARGAGAQQIALLHCVSAYPTPDDQQNLGAIRTLADAFGLPVGLSDHSTGASELTIAVAMALGARIYERHIKDSAGGEAIDEAVSSNAAQLAAIMTAAERARRAFGHGRREPQPAERGNLDASRRGLYATRDLQAGEIVQVADVIALRPANGVSPAQQARLIGSCLQRPIAAGAAFTQADLQTDRRGSSRPWTGRDPVVRDGVVKDGEGTRGAA
jgi:N,N'-diacetyllegionaminate synthase